MIRIKKSSRRVNKRIRNSRSNSPIIRRIDVDAQNYLENHNTQVEYASRAEAMTSANKIIKKHENLFKELAKK